ncbi:hypothetical protein K505DRAFT_322520 [Melanomma pulvis-pyrius CBS 109.77]|uniref:CFEM domain-containing protein n=1 Tax=Melanomma pulvis-pyrius CBS 109.77 TaxID=1314802 RepID=A0A6A6XMS8_9PLEO|nr:hypothetical protein K505DRAFT_322520 [Melanomma pulvis-pyrius CBS 109.77]
MPHLPSFDILFQKVNQSSYSLSLLYHSLYQAHIHSFKPILRSQPTAKMKYTFTVAAFLALATAQSIADLPSCSLSCVLTGVTATGCSPTDFACSCGKADILTPSVTPCVQKACSAADQAKVISTLEGICAAAGVPITIPTPGAPATSEAPAPEPTSEAPAPAPSSAAPTVETSAPVPSATDIVISSALPLPTDSCVIVTVTVTETSGKPSVPAAPTAPYPTGPAGTGGVPVPSGTGVYTSSPPLFTGAAAAVKVPAGIAGVLGMVAYLL